jgi:GTP-binding protein HflX
MSVLRDLGVGHIPIVTAWNKIDACSNPEEVRRAGAGGRAHGQRPAARS